MANSKAVEAMAATRKKEIFSAGCSVCEHVIASIRARACPSCDIVVLDMNSSVLAAWASDLGIASLPAVAIDSVLASCSRSTPTICSSINLLLFIVRFQMTDSHVKRGTPGEKVSCELWI